MSGYEPPSFEIFLTLLLGKTLLRPYYRRYVNGLPLSGSERVLDYGSGSGVCSRHLAARLARGGGRMTCVDISTTWQRVIRRQLRRFDNVDYACGHIAAVDVPDGAYDVVFIHLALHDVPAPERPEVVRALARKLKPGGQLLIREPTDPGHGLRQEELDALLTENGFEKVSSHTRQIPLLSEVCDGVFTPSHTKA